MRAVPGNLRGWRAQGRAGPAVPWRVLAAGATTGLLVLCTLRAGVQLAPTLVGGLAGLRAPAPALPAPVDLIAVLTDITPLRISTTARWRKIHRTVTADAVLHDRALWRDMQFDDWDTVPAPLREPALRFMLHVYSRALAGPTVWRTMSAADWDLVPQPVRAVACLRMVRYWTRRERIGAAFGRDPERIAQTIAAIVITESWFEHRAVNRNADGNRDLGLAQCSDRCRAEIAAMADRGEITFRMTEADYFNPFIATRVAAVWFGRELTRAGGDIPLAIRAYHRGLEHAMDERGDAYLLRVRDRRRRYVRGVGAPPTWRFLAHEAASPAAPAA